MRSRMTTIICIPKYRHEDPAPVIICNDARLCLPVSWLITLTWRYKVLIKSLIFALSVVDKIGLVIHLSVVS